MGMHSHIMRLRAAALSVSIVLYAAAAFGGTEHGQDSTFYTVQTLASHDTAAARSFAEALNARGYDARVVTLDNDGSGAPHKVRFGRYATYREAQGSAEAYALHQGAPYYVTQQHASTLNTSYQTAGTQPVHTEPAPVSAFRSFTNALGNAANFNPVEALFGRTYLEIAPAFSYRLQYEDNIDSNSKSSDKLSDFSTIYMPEIAITAITPRLSLEASAELDIAEYTSEKDFNYVDQVYAFTIDYQLNERLLLSAFSTYSIISNINRYFETDDPSMPAADTFERYKDKATFLGVSAQYLLTPRSTFSLTGSFARYDNLSTDGSDFYFASAFYSYSLSPKTKLNITANYFYYDFKNSLRVRVVEDDEDDEDDFKEFFDIDFDYTLRNYSITGGAEHTFENKLKLKLDVGYRYSDVDFSQTEFKDGQISKKATSGTGDGWIASLDLKHRYTDFEFNLNASHNINVDQRGQTSEQTRAFFSTRYDITPRLNARVLLRFQRSYADAEKDEFIIGRDQHTYYISSSLNYKMYRWLDISLSHAYRYSENQKNGTSLHANLFYVNLKFIPLRPMTIR
jgi:hypothetical protein